MSKVEIFHASFTDKINSFFPGSHFGSIQQALVAVAAHKFIDDWAQDCPLLYTCAIEDDANIVEWRNDWGSPNAQAALWNYLKAVGDETKFIRELYPTLMHSEHSENLCREYLLKEAQLRGHVGIRYPNKVEGQADSICVLQPQFLEIKCRSPLDWGRIKDAFLAVKGNPFGISDQLLENAHARAQAMCV